jgi:glycosyltransferase involved in cell wall biosynthesis
VSRQGEPVKRPRILAFTTDPPALAEELHALLQKTENSVVLDCFDRARRASSGLRVLWAIARERPSLVVMHNTGVAGGVTLMLARLLIGTRYVVISGDAVGPFLAARSRWLTAPGRVYEMLLLRHSAAFIGRTPYLAGRALTFGAPRAITVPHWAMHAPDPAARSRIRAQLGIDAETIVFGIVGSLNWTERYGYCYGAELVRALRACDRRDVAVVIVGDGNGMERLRELAGEELGRRVHLVGRVAPAQVPAYLAAFDVASLPQSCDQVGSFRYTTKLPEYLAADLPIVTGQIPLAYDVALGCSWRLPGDAPWSDAYIAALRELMETVDERQIAARRPSDADRAAVEAIGGDAQRARVAALLADLVAQP